MDVRAEPMLEVWRLKLRFGKLLGLIILRKRRTLGSGEAGKVQTNWPADYEEGNYCQRPGANDRRTIAPEAPPCLRWLMVDS